MSSTGRPGLDKDLAFREFGVLDWLQSPQPFDGHSQGADTCVIRVNSQAVAMVTTTSA